MKKWPGFLVAVAIAGGVAISPVSAQGQGGQGGGPGGPVRGGFGPGIGVCSTTNYTDIAAQALGMSATDLRVALVSGKTITDLATSKNVALQTVTDAITTARKADLAQSVKDGLITQAQADAITARQNPPTPSTGNAPATQQAPAPRRGPRELRVPEFNVVHRDIVVAQAIGISCPDLVKAMVGGQTIAQIATSKTVQAQTVIDALVNAQKAAFAQDVKEGLSTQSEADGKIAKLTAEVTAFVNNPRPPAGFRGFPGNDGPQGPGQGNGNGQPPAPGTDQGQPGQAPTAPATSS